MGFFSKHPPTFSDAVSKNKFVEQWVAGVLDEAGCNTADPRAAQEMADMAADGIVRQALKAVGEAYHDHGVVTYLEQLDPHRLSWRVDEIYNTTIELATQGRPGPVLRERINAFNRKVTEVSVDIRPNYLEYARVNYK